MDKTFVGAEDDSVLKIIGISLLACLSMLVLLCTKDGNRFLDVERERELANDN